MQLTPLCGVTTQKCDDELFRCPLTQISHWLKWRSLQSGHFVHS